MATTPHTEVEVRALPTCDICTNVFGLPNIAAHFDGRTIYGPWANMCERHFQEFGVGLGLGRGQRLIPTPLFEAVGLAIYDQATDSLSDPKEA